MLKQGKTPQEFIQISFSPQVAVLSSSKVDSIVSRNNLSFVELLQPFTLLDWEGRMNAFNLKLKSLMFLMLHKIIFYI